MDPATAAEALRQVWEGEDFPPPASILKGVKAEDAAALPPGFKYSLITLVEHSWFWQEIWLARLVDRKRPDMRKDWRVPDPGEWPEVRLRFLEGFEEALAIARAQPFEHKMASDEKAIETLLKIAVHNAYHVGQFVLVKRAVKGAESKDD
jgi:hypothetical protein